MSKGLTPAIKHTQKKKKKKMNAVVNARQKKVNTDYHSRAKSLDAR